MPVVLKNFNIYQNHEKVTPYFYYSKSEMEPPNFYF